MSKHKNLLIMGAGGHGKVVADLAGRMGTYDKIAFLDDSAPGEGFLYPYLGKCDAAAQHLDSYDIFVAIGNGAVRQRLMDGLQAAGACFGTVIAPDAVIAADVVIGPGSVVCPGAVINTGTKLGAGVIVNTAASVDHDCIIGDYCHVAVGARVCGTVCVGNRTWVGAGAVLINNINICPACMIGAGAVVVKDICSSGTYLGAPAKAKG